MLELNLGVLFIEIQPINLEQIREGKWDLLCDTHQEISLFVGFAQVRHSYVYDLVWDLKLLCVVEELKGQLIRVV